MPPIVRSVLAIFLGVISCFFLILAVEMLGQLVYPPPPGMDFSKPETVEAALKSVKPGQFAFVLAAWAIGTFIGAGIAARIAPNWKLAHGMVIGVLFLLASIGQMSMFPHPIWVWVIGVAEFLPVAYFGARLVSANPSPSTPSTESA
jgi:hypothetical protein